MARWWKQERSPWATASWPRPPDASLVSNPGTAPAGRPCSPPAQQEHRLLAEQVPEPPRRIEPQRPPPGIERHRLLHLGAGNLAEPAEILDRAEVDVGRIPPVIGQVVGARHVAAEQELQADAPMPEVGKRHDGVPAD